MEQMTNYLLDALRGAGGVLLLLLPFLILGILLQAFSALIRRNWVDTLGEKSFIFFAVPGTALHELSHALFCVIFRHRIQELKLFQWYGDGTLGYVKHTWDPDSGYQKFGNFFIGVAPLAVGTLAIYGLTAWLLGASLSAKSTAAIGSYEELWLASLNQCADFLRLFLKPELWSRWQTYLWLAAVLLLGSHITLSKSDLAGSWRGGATIIVLIAVFSLLYTRWGDAGKLLLTHAGNALSLCYSLLFLIWLFLFFILLGFAAAEGVRSALKR